MAKEKDNINQLFEKINKMYGKGTIVNLGDKPAVTEQMISSGSLMIDSISGGGIAKGRIAEVFGPESSGKTTLALQFVANCQKEGGRVCYIDSENALDKKYAKKLGVDIDNLALSQPDNAEQALTIAEVIAESGEFDLIIIDSVAALTPQVVLEGEIGDATIGVLARLMSKSLSRLNKIINTNHVAILFINQLRDKISTGFSMGPSETTTGGRALKFYASQRFDIRKTTAIKQGEDVVGYNTKIKMAKNKIVPPMQSTTIPLMFGKGFSADEEVLYLALEYEIITQSGAFYTLPTGDRFQGKAKMKAFLDEHLDVYEELRKEVKKRLMDSDDIEKVDYDTETGEVLED